MMLALVAEAAADVGRDDAHACLGDPELLRYIAADVMRHLRCAVERELAVGRIGDRDDGARLDRRANQPIVDEIDARDVRGRLERLAHRGLITPTPTEANIARCCRVQLRRLLSTGLT